MNDPTIKYKKRKTQMADYSADLDFNISEDAKEPGLVPDGTYHGNIVSVAYDSEKSAFIWKVALVDNGGECTDDETPIDGSQLQFTNWLPRPGDEDTPTASGRGTKRQAKINMLAEFMKKMQLTQNSVGEIIEAIDNAEFIGLEVDCQVGTREYQGSTFNEIRRMYV